MGDQIELGLGDSGDISVDLTRSPADTAVQENTHVPFVDLAAGHEPLIPEILEAWESILRTGAFTGGNELEEFESEFASYLGARDSVAVGSGTDALVLSLRAMGVGPGDEVITVPHTFIATAQAVVEVGGRPIFIDVDPATGTMDPSRIASAITSRTKVVLPVHLYGQPADLTPIRNVCRRYGLRCLEDAAQSHGARYQDSQVGSTGTATFSFYPSKNLGACGSGGAVATDDPALAERIRLLREHGEAHKHVHTIGGVNSRLDAIQAAALRIKLRHLDGWVEARRRLAGIYRELLQDTELELPSEKPDSRHAYHLYVVRHPARDQIRLELGEKGIETGLHYPVPIHLQPAFRGMGFEAGRFPHAENWAAQCLSLPMYPELSEDAAERVAAILIETLRSHRVPARRPA